MSTTTIRIDESDKKTIDEICGHSGQSAQAIIHEAVEEYRRRRLLQQANEAYGKLRNDPDASKAELEERDAWDIAVADGLEQT